MSIGPMASCECMEIHRHVSKPIEIHILEIEDICENLPMWLWSGFGVFSAGESSDEEEELPQAKPKAVEL